MTSPAKNSKKVISVSLPWISKEAVVATAADPG